MQSRNVLSTIFLFIILFGTLILSYEIFKPFLLAIFMGGVFAAILFPIHKRLRIWLKNNTLSSLVISILVTLLVIVPLIAIISMLTTEVLNVYFSLQQWVYDGKFQALLSMEGEGWLADMVSFVMEQFGRINQQFDVSINWQQQILGIAEKSTSFIVDSGTSIIKNIFITLFYFFIFLFSLFFLLRDGEKLVTEIKDISPLQASENEKIYTKFRDVSSASIFGSLFIAAVQGVLGGLAFLVLGVPNPLLWGTVMIFCALIPMIGTPIVWVPASFFLLLTGHWITAIILFAFCLSVVSGIDNVLRPFLLQGKSGLHPLVLFFAIIGGIFVYGPLGIILGPITIALFVTILHLYKTEFKDILQEQRKR